MTPVDIQIQRTLIKYFGADTASLNLRAAVEDIMRIVRQHDDEVEVHRVESVNELRGKYESALRRDNRYKIEPPPPLT